MESCPTKEAIEEVFKLIHEKTGYDIKQKLSECQIGGKGKRKMKGGAITKENIVTVIYLIIGLTITYFINKGIHEGKLLSESEIEEMLNGDCIGVLYKFYPEQAYHRCNIIKHLGIIINAAKNPKNVSALLFIAGAIYLNTQASSLINRAINTLADQIMNYMPKINEVTLEEGPRILAIQNGDSRQPPSPSPPPPPSPPPFNLNDINRGLLLEPGRRVTSSIRRPAPSSSFGTYRNPISNLFAPKSSALPLPIDEGEKGGKRKRKRKTRRLGHKTKKGGSKHHMSKTCFHGIKQILVLILC